MQESRTLPVFQTFFNANCNFITVQMTTANGQLEPIVITSALIICSGEAKQTSYSE